MCAIAAGEDVRLVRPEGGGVCESRVKFIAVGGGDEAVARVPPVSEDEQAHVGLFKSLI